MEILSAEDWYKKHKDSILAKINSTSQTAKSSSPCEQVKKNPSFDGGEDVGNASVTPIREDLVSSSSLVSLPNINFRVAVHALVVFGASSLLISASLEVFGYEWQGWFKAVLLELAIVSLAVSRSPRHLSYTWLSLREWAGFLFTKGTLIFLLYISFSVLHTGLEDQRSSALSKATSSNAVLTELIAERDNWQSVHDSYPESRITDKRNALTEISRLNQDIRNHSLKIVKGDNLTTGLINQQSNTEMMMRAVLLLLNIIFGHKLYHSMSHLRLPGRAKES